MEGKMMEDSSLEFEILIITKIWSFTFDTSISYILSFYIEFKDENNFYVIKILIWTLDEVVFSWLGVGILLEKFF